MKHVCRLKNEIINNFEKKKLTARSDIKNYKYCLYYGII